MHDSPIRVHERRERYQAELDGRCRPEHERARGMTPEGLGLGTDDRRRHGDDGAADLGVAKAIE